MILVDSSVLINFFRGVENEQTRKFELVLQRGIPFGINGIIYQELLQGAKSDKELKMLDEYLSTQVFYKLRKGIESYRAAASIYLKCRKKGIIIRSTVDLIIAQTAIENNVYLLHDDNDFTNIAAVERNLKEY
ncbi:MAG: PIN domain nuclease [Bacillota bacterium]